MPVRCAILLVLMVAGCHPDRLTITWCDAPRLPIGLGGHAAVVIDDHLIVAGGTSWDNGTKHWHDELWQLDESSQNWRPAGRLPTRVADAAAEVVNGKLELVGGWNENGIVAGQSGNNTVAMPGGAIVNDVFIIVGGTPDAANLAAATAACRGIDIRNPKDVTVASLPTGRALFAAAVCSDKLYVFGGMGPSASGAAGDLADVHSYDPKANRWTARAALPTPRRGAAAVPIDDHHILVIGGCRNDNGVPVMLDDVLLYDADADRFQRICSLPYAAACVRAVMFRGSVYVIGGEDKPKHRTARVVAGRLQWSRAPKRD